MAECEEATDEQPEEQRDFVEDQAEGEQPDEPDEEDRDDQIDQLQPVAWSEPIAGERASVHGLLHAR